MKYEFSERDVKYMKEALNIAVKSVGLSGAKTCLYLSEKLDNPIKEEEVKDEQNSINDA